MWKKLAAVGLGLVSVATAALAHDMFIKLNTYFLQPNTAVQVPLINGTFLASENAIAVNRMRDASLVVAGRRQPIDLKNWTAAGDTTFIGIRTAAAGTYVIGASTRHTDFELTAEEFNEYLEHDGIPDVLEARRRAGQLDVPVAERYSKHVKAVFQVGEARSGGFDIVLGYPAEVVPLDNPYNLRVGDALTVRCLVDGRAVPGQFVLAGGIGAGGVAIPERSGRTDADGVARFTIDRAGRWYIKFINMVSLDEPSPIDYESKWATLTFEIR